MPGRIDYYDDPDAPAALWLILALLSLTAIIGALLSAKTGNWLERVSLG